MTVKAMNGTNVTFTCTVNKCINDGTQIMRWKIWSFGSGENITTDIEYTCNHQKKTATFTTEASSLSVVQCEEVLLKKMVRNYSKFAVLTVEPSTNNLEDEGYFIEIIEFF